jgi:hypothetical protein
VVVALVASAALFALGAALEHHAEGTEASPPSSSASPPARGQHVEGSGKTGSGAGETGESREGGSEAPGGASGEIGHRETPSEQRSEESSERIVGVNPDAPPLVIAAVAVSVLLAAALWFRRAAPALLGVIFVVGLGAAVFDVREAAHQADHSRPGIMAIAIVVALLHLAASGCAAALALGSRREFPRPDSPAT